MSRLGIKHLFGLREVDSSDIRLILDTAASFREVLGRTVKKVPSLRGITVVNLFFENSTRTRISFELAEKRLSADTVNFSTGGSSLAKGESLEDTVRNIESMKVDVVVVRHSSTGVPAFIADVSDAIVINAGDGCNEHPTQALLDIFTMEQRLGGLKNKKVTIVGDIRHSRVARSNVWGLKALGADVTLCAPSTLMPADSSVFGVRVTHNLSAALEGADVVMALRLQKERQQGGLLPSLYEYRQRFGITRTALDRYCPNAIIMHPGPVNRGVELDSDVVDGPQSVILDQVTNGVAVRMSVLYLLSGGEG
jgi:aspartate carbamoyltransferase catalytic subunit